MTMQLTIDKNNPINARQERQVFTGALTAVLEVADAIVFCGADLVADRSAVVVIVLEVIPSAPLPVTDAVVPCGTELVADRRGVATGTAKVDAGQHCVLRATWLYTSNSSNNLPVVDTSRPDALQGFPSTWKRRITAVAPTFAVTWLPLKIFPHSPLQPYGYSVGKHRT